MPRSQSEGGAKKKSPAKKAKSKQKKGKKKIIRRPGIISSENLSPIFFASPSADRATCQNRFKLGEFIKSGKFGSVQEACEKATKDCKFVVKVIPYRENNKRVIQNEIEITKRLKGTGIAPEFIDSWVCGKGADSTAFIVLERWDGSIKKDKLPRDKKLGQNILKLVRKLHKKKILHGDLHMNNVLFRRRNGKLELALTDFGLSNDYSSKKRLALSDDFLRPKKFDPDVDISQLASDIEELGVKIPVTKKKRDLSHDFLVKKFSSLDSLKNF